MIRRSLFLGTLLLVTIGSYAGVPIDSLYKLQNLVYGQEIVPQWIDGTNQFVYKNTETDGMWFYTLDAVSGQKTRTKEAPSPRSSKNTSTTNDTRAVSPNKKWEAKIVGHNIRIGKVGDMIESSTLLTYDGVEGFGYDQNFYWSADSRYLITTKTRKPTLRRIPLIESRPVGQVQPLFQWRNYPKPGDEVAIALPVLFDVEKMRQVPLNTEQYKNQYYLRLTGWQPNSNVFTFEFNERGHKNYIVAAIDVAKGEIRNLIHESAKTFIDYDRNFRFDTPDGHSIVWSSERDGWRHLYMIDAHTGKVKKQITQGSWVVREVDYVDVENQKIYFFASGFNTKEDPYNLHYCSVGMDGKGFLDLTPVDANHKVYPSEDRTYFVDVYSRPDMPWASVLRRTWSGELVAEIQQSDVSQLEKLGWQKPEVFVAKGRDGKTDIWGTIYRPFNFDPSKSYPIVEDIYAGPHSSHVTKNFVPIEHFISALAEQGFIVVKIDGMGTSNRSKAFHDLCWKNLKDAGFPDRILWIKAAAQKYTYMDTNRVGIYGWSAGGQNAMGALLFHNDFYKAAVALCGCHDNRVDKISWNERWMGYPVDESYAQSSNVDNAHLLKGNLLLINGELDTNVDPASSMQVVDALVRANKNFEQLYLPGRGHALGGRYEMDRLRDFFVRHLGSPSSSDR